MSRVATVMALLTVSVCERFRTPLRTPLHRWGWQHRLAAALASAAAAWLTTMQWVSSGDDGADVASIEVSGTAHASEIQRLRHRRAWMLARVEATQATQAAASFRDSRPHDVSLGDGDVVDVLAEVAAEPTLRIDQVEPGPIERTADWMQRSVGVLANGSYAGIAYWIAGLDQADRPIGIDALRLERW